MNRGPMLLQNPNRYWASLREISFIRYSSAMFLAPMGKPHRKPVRTQYTPCGLMRSSGQRRGERKKESFSVICWRTRRQESSIKGNSAGIMV